MSIGVKMRRLLIISTRICTSILFGHPFLVAMTCCCMSLRVYSPFLFSILVSASPVIICTAILLGTLLLFGEASTSQIEKENLEDEETKVSHENSATSIAKRGENYSVDRFTWKRKDGLKKVVDEEKSLLNNNENKIMNDEGSHDKELRKRVIEKVERGFDELEKKRKMQEEILGIKEVLIGNHYSMIQHMEQENLNVQSNKLVAEFAEGKEKSYLGFSNGSSWKRLDDDVDVDADDEDEDEDDSSDDENEDDSSSNTSLENILPMIDELHPLLDEEIPRPTHISHSGSSSSSKKSHNSNKNIIGPDDDMVKLLDGVDEEDNEKGKRRDIEDENEVFDNESNDNDEEEEEVQRDKEDESTSAIKWTEDDQKNVMDLGTLEIERNQRLENLIAKRIARRNLSMIAERNLIDFDGVDLPNNIPSISTRRNPFDFDDDNPGSAPSIFLPRQKPFDLAYDSIEQKSHLKENNFRQEFTPSQHREPFFRRHQSFNVGPSFLGVGNIERQDFRWKPYFSAERNNTEGAGNDIFQRQLSEGSDSKVSSTLETESVSSTMEERKLSEKDISHETNIISNMDHGSTLMEHGSLSSDDVDSLDIDQKVEESVLNHDENRIGEILNNGELISRMSASGETTPLELNISEILSRMQADEDEEYVSRSTLSSSSERDETIFDMNKESSIHKKYGQNEEFSDVAHIGKHSSLMDNSSPYEQDHVWSSTADTKNGSNFNQDMNASSQKDLTTQRSWSDKVVAQTSFGNHDQTVELNKTHEWSIEETYNDKNVDVLETFGAQDSISEITSSTHGSSSTSPKSLEDKSSYGDSYSEDAYKAFTSEGNDGDEEDDLRGFDEGLFSELDTTGNLIVKEVASETQDEQVPVSRIGSPKFDSLPNEPSPTEIREELISLVVRSGDDFHLNSKKFDEEDNAQEIIDSKMMRENIGIGKHQVPDETNSNEKVSEASSLQDIDNSVKKVSRGNKMELPQQSNSKYVPEQIVDESENSMKIGADLQIIEASSVDDIDFNTIEAHQVNAEEELDWFDSSDSLEERNEKDVDST